MGVDIICTDYPLEANRVRAQMEREQQEKEESKSSIQKQANSDKQQNLENHQSLPDLSSIQGELVSHPHLLFKEEDSFKLLKSNVDKLNLLESLDKNLLHYINKRKIQFLKLLNDPMGSASTTFSDTESKNLASLLYSDMLPSEISPQQLQINN